MPLHLICRFILIFSTCVIFVVNNDNTCHAHGGGYALRTYLNAGNWFPYRKYASLLQSTVERPLAKKDTPFAGMNPKTLPLAGAAYRSSKYETALKHLKTLRNTPLNHAEHEEAHLLEAKCYLQLSESPNSKDTDIAEAEIRLLEFLETATTPRFLCEARGWLARVHYLQSRYTDAMKFYMDQLQDPESIFSESSLLESIKTICSPYWCRFKPGNKLEDFMDTPEHALFITNFITSGNCESCNTGQTEIFSVVEKNKHLFNNAKHNDNMTLALIRTALYTGNINKALELDKKLPVIIPNKLEPERLWMRACCYFLTNQVKKAEIALLALLKAPDADRSLKIEACTGLIGVYDKLNLPVKMLHAAVMQAQIEATVPPTYPPENESLGIRMAPCYLDTLEQRETRVWAMDLPYFLDAQLTIPEIQTFLAQYGNTTHPYLRRLVQFSLAVRLAREENFPQAINILKNIQKELVDLRSWHEKQLAKTLQAVHTKDFKKAGSLLVELQQKNITPPAEWSSRTIKHALMLYERKLYDFIESVLKDLHRKLEDPYSKNNPGACSTSIVRKNLSGYISRYSTANRLYTAAFNSHDKYNTKQRQLEAQYQYAYFLYKNPDKLFFNRVLWGHSQQFALFNTWGLPEQDTQIIKKRDQHLKDTQEERWRAAHILMNVAEEAGYTPLGRKAVSIAMDSLVRIRGGVGKKGERAKKIDHLIHYPWQIPEKLPEKGSFEDYVRRIKYKLTHW